MSVSTPNHNVNLFAIGGATPCVGQALVFARLARKVHAPTPAGANAYYFERGRVCKHRVRHWRYGSPSQRKVQDLGFLRRYESCRYFLHAFYRPS